MPTTRSLVPQSRRRVVSLLAAFVLAVGPVTVFGPSEVQALETVSGVVFEDIAGDGLADGGIGSPDNPGVIGVTVALYLDDGNGVPDGADTWVADDVTDSSGTFSLVLATAVDHWVVVDSRDVNPSVGSATDAEQTYGPAGALCTNGDSPETFTALSTARSCYGGYRGDVVDGNNIATNAEHLALVNTTRADVDFGFSFNVVTRAIDALSQGTLRNFITNSTTMTGANSMRFVPTIPPNDIGGTWWEVSVGSPLPAIMDGSTVIDGTAYELADGVTPRETNVGTVGYVGSVGIGPDGVPSTGDEANLAGVAAPELEIQNDRATLSTTGIDIQANSVTVRALAIFGFGGVLPGDDGGGTIHVGTNGSSFTDIVIEDNIIGGDATFSDPGAGIRGTDVGVMARGSTGIVRRSLVGYNEASGLKQASGVSGSWTIEDSDFHSNGMASAVSDGIDATSSTGFVVQRSRFTGNGGTGIDLGDSATVQQNTVSGNGIEQGNPYSGSPDQWPGVRIDGTGNTVRWNEIAANYGPGVMVTETGTDNRITQNSMFDNGEIDNNYSAGVTDQIGIDLIESGGDNAQGTSPFRSVNDDGDGDTGGNGVVNFAVIDTALIDGADLVVTGFAPAGAIVEVFIADPEPGAGPAPGYGEGRTYLFSEIEGSVADADNTTDTYGPPDPNGIFQGTETSAEEYEFRITLASMASAVVPGDQLTATATLENPLTVFNTSEFSGMATVGQLVDISGTVFEDIAGDGLADGVVGDGLNPGVANVTVTFYEDDGDGLPDAGDTSAGWTTTGVGGTYTMPDLTGTSYWVVVESADLTASQDLAELSTNIWAEQSYGPAGSLCADGAGGTASSVADGACYGGRQATTSDSGATWHTDREHLALIDTSTGDVSGTDFGFSFNIVTTTRGGNVATDDDPANAGRTVQGSLRQFLENASALSGGNAMRFVPAEAQNAGAAEWWSIAVAGALPVIDDGFTTIDGTAVSLADGISPVDSNPLTLGGGTVGVGPAALLAVEKPELELIGDRVAVGFAVQSGGDDTTIRDLSIWGFFQNVTVSNADRSLIAGNVIGTPPDAFADPGASRTASRNMFVEFAADWTISGNLVGYAEATAIAIYEATSTGWTITGTEFRSNGLTSSGSDGIAIHAGAVGLVEANLIADNAGFGIDAREAGDGNVFRNNTVSGNGHGNGTPTQTGGLRLMGSGQLVELNVISGQTGPGIIVAGEDLSLPAATPAINIEITQNHFSGNGGNAIDLNTAGTDHQTGDGITLNGTYGPNAGNEGLDAPTVVSATTASVTGTACVGCRVELYRALAGPGDTSGAKDYGEGVEYLGFDIADGAGDWTVSGVTAPFAGQDVSAIAIDVSNNTSEFGENVTVVNTGAIVGTVFEDIDYGGGAGRSLAGSGGTPVAGARVELYDNLDDFVAAATTDPSGVYTFASLAPGNYSVRTVNDTVDSTRATATGAEWPVQTYRVDASSGTAIDVTAEIGGANPAAEDDPANVTSAKLTTLVAQSVVPVTVGATTVSDVDFGYNFSSIVNTNDIGQGSLSQFLTNANNLTDDATLNQVGLTAGAETSVFVIPTSDPGYLASPLSYTISLVNGLPDIIDPVILDGTTQSDYPGTPIIALDGSLTPASTHGFTITAGSTVVRGFTIGQFPENGIYLATAGGNTIESNYIGVDVTGGGAWGNSAHGILLDPGADTNIIGGAGVGNVISANGDDGIAISSSHDNRIEGNFIGADHLGTSPLGNLDDNISIQAASTGNTIGGAAAGTGNVIADAGAGNIILGTHDGVYIAGAGTSGNSVLGNHIGTDLGETIDLGNGYNGIRLWDLASGNTIGGTSGTEANVITNNLDRGVLLDSTVGAGNTIRGNAISDNGALGIDLQGGDVEDGFGNTSNDALDADGPGPNNWQNRPLITEAVGTALATIVSGSLHSSVGLPFEIDFYASPSADPGGSGEGALYLGSTSATTDGSGNATFDRVVLPTATPIGHVISATATSPTGDTSEFSVAAAVTVGNSVSGTVFEDIVGDHLLDGVIGDINNPGVSGVFVYLYSDDDGDGFPDAGEALQSGVVNPVFTAGGGTFTFTGVPDGDYLVAVDSRTVNPTTALNAAYSIGHVWADQTYAVVNGWCADGAGGSARRTPGDGSGPCYGGRQGSVSDALPAASADAAEHITSVTVAGALVAGIDSGFSYNVMTTAGTATQSLDNARSGQGTLDQFIANANAIAGPNTMRFVPSQPANDGTGSWWRLDYSAAVAPLEGIHDADTTVDGTALDLIDGSSALDTNPGYLGANAGGGLTVGVDGLALPQVAKPELEIASETIRLTIANTLRPNRSVLQDLSVWNATDGVFVGTGLIDDLVLRRLVVGTPPDSFTDPGNTGAGVLNGIRVESSGVGGLIADNLVGFVDTSGIHLETGTNGWTITGNEVRTAGRVNTAWDGVLLWGTSTLVQGNLIADQNAFGVDANSVASGAATIDNNTIDNSGIGGVQTGGIRLGNSDNIVSRNIIQNSAGPGVVVWEISASAALNNRITENQFGSNGGIAIDLGESAAAAAQGDGHTLTSGTDAGSGNLGLDAPIIEDASPTTVTGSGACAGCTIELYKASPGIGDTYLGDTYGEGVEHVGTTTADGVGDWAISGLTTLVLGDLVSATTLDTPAGPGNTSEFAANFRVNEPPTGSLGPVSELEDALPRVVNLWAAFDDSSDADSALTYVVLSNDNTGLVTTAIDPMIGELTLTFVSDQNGVANITVRVTDTGGLHVDAPFVVTVTAVNDPPTFTDGGPVSVPEDNGATAVSGWAAPISEGPPDESGQILTFAVTGNTNPGLFSVPPSLDETTGDLTFTPLGDANGSSNITVELSDDGGGTDTSPPVVFTITVTAENDPPVVTAGPGVTVDEGDTVTLAPATFSDPDTGDTHSATIDWGDGTPTEAGTVDDSLDTVTGSHPYVDNGTYIVTVDVTDPAPATGSDTFSVTVNNVAPTVTAGADVSGISGTPVAMNPAVFSDPGTTDTHTATIDWGDGTPATVIDPATSPLNDTHTYATSGTYVVTVTVTDNDSDVGTDTFTVTINNTTPTVTAGPGVTVDEGDTVTLAPATFSDPDTGDTHSATIDWGDGTPTEAGTVDDSLDTVTGSHPYVDNGTYIVTVDVTDPAPATGSDTFSVTVNNVAPTVTAGADVSGISGTPVAMNPAVFSDPGTTDTHTATIDWGDGTPATVIDPATSPLNDTHTYATSGTYVVTVTVTDNDSDVGTDTFTVTINNTTPTVTAGPGVTVDEGDVVALAPATFSDPDTGDTHSATIDWGDGTPTEAGTVDDSLDTVTGSHPYVDNGTYIVTVDVTDPAPATGSDTFSVTVNNVAPTVTAGAVSVNEGSSATVVASFVDPGALDTHTATIDWGDGTALTAMTVDQALDSSTASHAYLSVGSYTTTITVTDNDGGLGTTSATVTVNNVLPVLDPVPAQTVVEHSLLSVTAAASDIGPLTFSLVGEPPGAVIGASSGVLTWTPGESDGPGGFDFTITVVDGSGASDSTPVHVDVTEKNSAPVLTDVTDQTNPEGSSVSLIIHAVDADLPAQPLTYTAAGLPAGMSIDSLSGAITGTPGFETAGSHTVSVTVFDSGTPSLSDATSFVWEITDVNRAPIAFDQSFGAAAGLPIDITLTGVDPDGDLLVFEIVDDPTLGVVLGLGGGGFTYLAPAEAAGLDVFTFRVGDGAVWSAPATVTVNVGANLAPVAVGETFSIEPGAVIAVDAPGILGNDSDPDGAALTAQLATAPKHGSLSLSPNGSFTYRHEGATGVTDTFSYVAFDGLRSSPPVVVRIVITANLPPSAVDDVVGLDEDSAVEFDPLGNDTDAENHELWLLSISQPEVGTIVRRDGNSIRYTPVANWFGTEVVTYEIVDEYGAVDRAQITFVVESINDAPTATGLSGSVEADEPHLDIDLSGEFGDVDADALEISLSTPRHGTAVLVGDNVVRYQPTAGFRGSDSFTYTISDGNGGTATAIIAISVDGIDADAVAFDVVGFNRPAAASLTASNSITTTFRSFRLVVGSVFNTMELFRLPIFILILGFLGTALTSWRRTLGPSSGAIHLPGGDPKSWSVVFVDDSAQLIGRAEPGYHSDPVHRFVAAETALRGTGAEARLGDETWLEIDSASGSAWVPASRVTEAVPPGRFAGDERVYEVARDLRAVIAEQGAMDRFLSDRGLAVSHFAPPQRFSREFAGSLLVANPTMTWWNRTGGVASLEGGFHDVIARPLAMSMDRYEPRANADVSAAIPTELVNFHRLSVGDPAIPGKDAWHLFFEYIDDEPTLVGIWKEGDHNLESLRADTEPDV